MKILKKTVLAFLLILTLLCLGFYFYFDQKFSPEENYLTVKNESGKVIVKWLGENKNVMLLPVHLKNDSTTYFMQFDTGSPNTIFYQNSLAIFKNKNQIKTQFTVGNTEVSSDRFKIISISKNNGKDSIKIIGTIGSDILDQKKTIVNFKENYVVFNISKEPKIFSNAKLDFKFKKRKIIISGILNGKKEEFLYDSGTSAYELLTNKNVWQKLKSPNSKPFVEKAQSWERILTSYTAKSNQTIKFKNKELILSEVTYVEGISQSQYMLMKFSGMTGMLGNKIFLKNSLYIDCKEEKISIN
ncbi:MULTISPECIES: hypothetical protein [Chryseobacterium]|uniref:hypothetical protein n=1 Tax=Chryseobacterium TaxID=59732 RepID=UPI00195C7CEB|nr:MULTISPECIES: hypothetical protein [Chryseobacterium]MBM7419227.1 hypothetical protein [Chryseobacterium sp. JUb44]MDH6209150.1 hypothetical protein [Chryseobacterium sp. BIGb0186]WSO12000.1 hypothetical protein VUJ64_08845 [Chryseobacterium scophthalmum]